MSATPMARLKSKFNQIELNIRIKHPHVQISNLNRAQGGMSKAPFYKKEVNCDFLRIYHDDQKQYTVGIEFEYLNIPTSDWSASISVGVFSEVDPLYKKRRFSVVTVKKMPFSEFKSIFSSLDSSSVDSVDSLCVALTGKHLKAIQKE